MTAILKEMLRDVHEYGIRTASCRRHTLLNYFGEEVSGGSEEFRRIGKCCDVCDRQHLTLSANNRMELLRRRSECSHLPDRPVPFLEPSVRIFRFLVKMGASDLAGGIPVTATLLKELLKSVPAGVLPRNVSWKWWRGLFRMLVRDNWLNHGVREIQCVASTSKRTSSRRKRRVTRLHSTT